MGSGGPRARSGPPPDPASNRSADREWLALPRGGYRGPVPEFPLRNVVVHTEYFEDGNKIRTPDDDASESYRESELALWRDLWAKPQGFAWHQLGLKYQVAAYVRAFIESVSAGASAGLKTAVLRMETELGISIAGMRQNGWNISEPEPEAPTKPAPRSRGGTKKQTSSGSWLTGVNVDAS